MIRKKREKSKGKMIVRANKTTVDGIQFASALESKMYRLLKEAGMRFGYESVNYTVLEGFVYSTDCYEKYQKRNPEMTDRRNVLKVGFTPDFVGENEEYIIEVKGRPNESFPLRWKMFKALMQQREKPPLLFKPSTTKECEQVIQILKEKGYGRKTNSRPKATKRGGGHSLPFDGRDS